MLVIALVVLAILVLLAVAVAVSRKPQAEEPETITWSDPRVDGVSVRPNGGSGKRGGR